MGQLVDIVRSSLPSPELLAVESMDERESKIIIRVQGKDTPRCPACAGSRVSYHSRYYRTLRDLPWQGRPVQIQLHIRRFRCRNADCQRKIFAKRLSAVAVPRARETQRRCEILTTAIRREILLPGQRVENCGLTAGAFVRKWLRGLSLQQRRSHQ